MKTFIYVIDFWLPSLVLQQTLGTFFNSFRKGPVVCRGLDIDLSGKVAKKNDSNTEKRSPRPQLLALTTEAVSSAVGQGPKTS